MFLEPAGLKICIRCSTASPSAQVEFSSCGLVALLRSSLKLQHLSGPQPHLPVAYFSAEVSYTKASNAPVNLIAYRVRSVVLVRKRIDRHVQRICPSHF